MRKISTAAAEVEQIEGTIYYVNYYATIDSVEVAQQHIAQVKEAFELSSPILILSDIRRLKKAPKEVRDFFASDEMAQFCKARSVLVGSGISKLLGNWYMRFSKPKNPTKVFTNHLKAEEWLKSLFSEHSKQLTELA